MFVKLVKLAENLCPELQSDATVSLSVLRDALVQHFDQNSPDLHRKATALPSFRPPGLAEPSLSLSHHCHMEAKVMK